MLKTTQEIHFAIRDTPWNFSPHGTMLSEQFNFETIVLVYALSNHDMQH